jgi:chromosome segregation ATPase
MDMQGAIKELQETAIVMAGIQARQAEALKGRGEWLVEHEHNMAEHERRMTRIESTMAAATEKLPRIESNLAEATDKLNALISIVDDLVRRRKERE